jgi:hypothetical protein
MHFCWKIPEKFSQFFNKKRNMTEYNKAKATGAYHCIGEETGICNSTKR